MRILYATDGSEGALAGARFLNSLTLGADSEVRLLAVAQNDAQDVEGALDAAQAALSGGTDGSGGGDAAAPRVAREVRRGNAAEGILAAAEEKPTDLIVVGTHGRSAIPRFFLGSVAERVARHARCPVLLARPLRDRLDRAVLGVDGSERAAQTAEWFRQFPLPADCDVRIVQAVTSQEAVRSSRAMRVPAIAADLRATVAREREEAEARVKSLAALYAAGGRKATTELPEGDPASRLLGVTEEWQADLVVVGATGLSGVDRFLLGSVSEKVVRHAQCSVLVARPQPTTPAAAGAAA